MSLRRNFVINHDEEETILVKRHSVSSSRAVVIKIVSSIGQTVDKRAFNI